jgi:NADH-quinone oxidoreductase subunit H
LAVTSVGVYGIFLAGYASNSKYSMLGALRSSAQMISYEMALGLSLVPVFILAGSVRLVDIVNAQHTWWFIIPLLPAFFLYLIAGIAETNRAPFDLPEAETELVAGYHTEYSGLRFALFFMAEYINMIIVSSIATVVFLGGWWGPAGILPGPWWFLLKVVALLYIYVWLRATLPRMRYDRLMALGWKSLFPLSLAMMMATAVVVVAAQGVF